MRAHELENTYVPPDKYYVINVSAQSTTQQTFPEFLVKASNEREAIKQVLEKLNPFLTVMSIVVKKEYSNLV